MANLKDWDVLWLSCSSQETLSKDDNSIQSNNMLKTEASKVYCLFDELSQKDSEL